MDIGTRFQELVAARLAELGLKPSAAEAALGLKTDSLRNLFRENPGKAGPRRPRIDTAEEICRALNLEIYVGPPRDTGPIEQLVLDGDDYTHIPFHAATLSAGGGAINAEEAIVDHLAFKRTWLTRIGLSPSNAVLARVALGEMGESMSPTIAPGDMVLIDTAKREIPTKLAGHKSRHGPIYAFTTDDGARVKRIAQLDDAIILVSDNPDVPPEFLKRDRWAEINVIGKVVWWGHTAEE
tara:strand:+ start:4422 stop:5138 length:717 start_codon:yes stop_codon:yes gene_type:complete